VFEHTKGLNELNMADCREITGDIAVLGNLTKATSIDMMATTVTMTVTGNKEAIEKALPNCQISFRGAEEMSDDETPFHHRKSESDSDSGDEESGSEEVVSDESGTEDDDSD